MWKLRKQRGGLLSGEPWVIGETIYGTEAQACAELYAIRVRMGEVLAEADGMIVKTFFRLNFVPRLRRQVRANLKVYGYESTSRPLVRLR